MVLIWRFGMSRGGDGRERERGWVEEGKMMVVMRGSRVVVVVTKVCLSHDNTQHLHQATLYIHTFKLILQKSVLHDETERQYIINLNDVNVCHCTAVFVVHICCARSYTGEGKWK